MNSSNKEDTLTGGKDEHVSVEPGGIGPDCQKNNVKKYDSILIDYKMPQILSFIDIFPGYFYGRVNYDDQEKQKSNLGGCSAIFYVIFLMIIKYILQYSKQIDLYLLYTYMSLIHLILIF